MAVKYRIHNAPSPFALEQGRRIGASHAIIYSIGPCSSLTFHRDPVTGRYMDEFPQYFDDYPKVSELRHSADASWLEPLRGHIRAMCSRAETLGIKPVFHLYEPMLPLAFEREYPDLVGVFKRPTQEGTIDVHSLLDPDNPQSWELMKNKYRELARDFPEIAMYVITTGDTASAYLCTPEAEMPVYKRLVKLVEAAREGVREARKDAVVCFRLWWRNFPDEFYRDGHRLIGELTGLENAGELMCRIGRPYNDPSVVLPKLFEELPQDVPVMYKSSRMDIHDNTPLTHVLGKYPAEREQIMEISYEMHHEKSYPWCKAAHIRKGLDAVKRHGLAGYVSLPINMGNNQRDIDPESGNLGRMNTWLFENLAKGDRRSDRELVAAWLEKEYGSSQPDVVVDALLDAEVLADEGIQWGRGINHRVPFASIHATKLCWMFDGFIQPDFPYAMAKPSRELIEGLIEMKHSAHRRAVEHIHRLDAARPAIAPRLYQEIRDGYQVFADYISLRRDWSSYILMLYAVEKGVYPPERKVLGRMSRYVESFIANLVRLKDSPAGRKAMTQLAFPDPFPLS
ncbi:MAG TPA: hypothetical protein ENN09_02500 [Planctomycetes bacterium]|nr:hypothetical protein [Planctomycetota bacterium]